MAYFLKTGFAPSFVVTSVTSSTGRHTPVIDLGGNCLLSVKMSTVAWTDADLSVYGSANSTSTAGQVQLYGSKLAGTVGSTNQSAATYETTKNRVLTFNPNLTDGIRYLMLKSSATQASTRALEIGLG